LFGKSFKDTEREKGRVQAGELELLLGGVARAFLGEMVLEKSLKREGGGNPREKCEWFLDGMIDDKRAFVKG